MTRPIRVLLFATAREAVGLAVVERDIPAHGSTIGAVLSGLIAEHPRLETVLKSSRLVRNGEYVRGHRTRVAPGDEIAVHPPYSGG